MTIDLEEMKRILKECVIKGGRFAENLKKDGNIWLAKLVAENAGNDYSELIDKAETFEELMIIWGFINLLRGYEMNNREKASEDVLRYIS